MKKKFLLLFLFIIPATPSLFIYAQENQLKFQRYAVEQGLSVTAVQFVTQDDNGFLWIATIDGLHRYDGYTFKIYKYRESDSTSISANSLNTLYKDKKGQIWVGTFDGGLNKLDPATEKFQRFKNIPGNINSISNNRVKAICEDNDGMLWIGTEYGLNKYDPSANKFTRYFNEKNNPASLSGNSILSLRQDTEGNLWVGTTDGLNKLINNKDGSSWFLNYKNEENNPSSLSDNLVFTLFESHDKTLWIGTSDGLNKFDPQRNNFTVYKFDNQISEGANAKNKKVKKVYTYMNGYGTNAIRAIHENQGKLWLATDKGLKIFNPQTKGHVVYTNNSSDIFSISNDLVSCLYADKTGNLWIGTFSGGLNKIDLKPSKFLLYQAAFGNPYGLSEENIRSIYEDKEGDLWIGTWGGGLNRWDKKTKRFYRVKRISDQAEKNFNPDNVWVIYEDNRGFIWIGTSEGLYQYNFESDGFTRFTNNPNDLSSISNNIIRSVFQDSKENLWIGTGGGLNKFNYTTNTFLQYTKSDKDINSLSDNMIWVIREAANALWVGTDNGLNKLTFNEGQEPVFTRYMSEKKGGISNNTIRSIYEDKNKIIWIATLNGLNELDPKTNKIRHYNEEDGLPNSYLYSILEDAKGNLWISTNKGISKFDVQNKTFRNYDKSDGLQNNEFNTGAYYQNKKGELFFGGPNGFNKFHPGNLNDNPNIPPVVITSIKIMDAETNIGVAPYKVKELQAYYNENVLAFEFASLDFTFPEKNQYAYKLEGFDKDWIYSGTRRYVNYTNLDPGKYIFKVIASNNDGTWNKEGTHLKVTIIPPFWKTTFFYVLCIAAAVLSIYTFFKVRLQTLRRRALILQEQIDFKTLELREEKEKVEEQHKIIKKKNQNITASINYARRIQNAVLPAKENITKILPEAFILIQPKDIVSGDFCWFSEVKNPELSSEKPDAKLLLVAAVDCTGHGIPGAFMSLIGNELLNDIVHNKGITTPSGILEKLHEELIITLKKGERESGTVDGMDVSLCAIDPENKTLEFASTGQPLILIRNGKTEVIRSGKYPIGLVLQKERHYETHTFSLQEKDVFYIFTDGYTDQFGGDNDEKFSEEQLKGLLFKIHDLGMNEQETILKKTVEDWKGSHPQLDDILIIGMRLK